ncbi:uncharacterized protein [Henckelia pumila]|uniref:uncharacterized protein n=1 Tax=Henckelia pumila TaxID=405737 RepID=UPI003C6DE7D4
MIKDLQRDYGVELEYHRVWAGKEMTMHGIHGTDEGSYDKLRCGCRSLIFLDGTHIKNKYKGCLLVVVAKDANDDIFTLAYAVVCAENDSNWEWFCYHLKNVLASQYIMVFHRYTFFSDRHPGLIKAIQSVFPGSYHSYCLRHLVDNFVKQQRREKTLEMTRELSPRKEKDVSIAYGKSRTLKVLKFCGSQFEVVDGDKTFAVDLNSWHCSCRAWQIYRLPCKHACACIESKSLSVYQFCDGYFKVGMYRQAYKGIINLIPISDMNEGYLDDELTIYAPTTRSQPGRRRTKRIPSQVEQRVKKHKSLLNQESSSECCGKRATRSGGIL